MISILRTVLVAGFNPNERDDTGDTLLLTAVKAGRADVVDLLLEFNADTRAPDANGLAPRDVASAAGDKKVLEVLAKYGV